MPIRGAALLCGLILYIPGYAETPTVAVSKRHVHATDSRLHEVVVSASQPISVFEMDRSATIFTADDIAINPAQSVPELLASAPNIALTSFSGNDKFTRLDVRGSGDTSVSNVLTLIDGIKINTPDLAGADFSSIALNHVERVEIIRGGNSVRYGNGASHGIINIITRRPTQTSAFAKRERGSFASDTTQLSATAGGTNGSLMLNHLQRQSDGYREHNKLKSTDFLIQYRQQIGNSIHLLAKNQIHEDNYQLPGPLSRTVLENGLVDPSSGSVERGTEGTTEDSNQQIQLQFNATKVLSVISNMQYRERENIYVHAKSLSNTAENKRDRIDLSTFASETHFNWLPSGTPFIVTAGFDYSNAEYQRTNGGQYRLRRTAISGDIISRALYFHTRTQATTELVINTGYRRDKTDNRFAEHQLRRDANDPACIGQSISLCPVTDQLQRTQQDDWDNEAIELGLVYALNNQTRFYASAARTFRNPNVDELALPLFETDPSGSQSTLQPQTANRYEAGIKFDANTFSINAGGFLSKTDNEIIFREADNSRLSNFNFDKAIERSGVEFETTAYLNSTMSAGLSAGYTDASTSDGKRIPLVARVNASAHLSWQITSDIHFYHDTRYVGARHDGNDFNNTGLYELPAYQIAGAKLRYKNMRYGLTLYIAANNLYNERYITTSYSNQGYPANERSFYGGISIDL